MLQEGSRIDDISSQFGLQQILIRNSSSCIDSILTSQSDLVIEFGASLRYGREEDSFFFPGFLFIRVNFYLFDFIMV